MTSLHRSVPRPPSAPISRAPLSLSLSLSLSLAFAFACEQASEPRTVEPHDDWKESVCSADLDGSGAVDSADMLEFIASWGPCSGCASDLDGSGAVDSADLLAMISQMGTLGAVASGRRGRYETRVTVPCVPSTITSSPSTSAAVAQCVPTTAGSRCSRATIEVWVSTLPKSVTSAPAQWNTIIHAADVDGHTRTSPRCSRCSWWTDVMTRTRPR